MAARMLAMTAATAPASRLCLNQGVENSGSFGGSKDFCGVRLSSRGVDGLRVNAARRDVVVYAGKRKEGSSGNGKKPRSGMQARRKQKSRIVEDDDDDAAAEKALEALFKQLEMDLNSEDDDGDDDVEFTDEELAEMTKELEAAFSGMDLEGLEDDDEAEGEDSGLVDMVMTDGVYSEASGVAKGSIQKSHKQDEDDDEDEEELDEEEDEDDEQRMVPLEKWQLRKLAAAVEKGRRNVNVKSLAAELGMDRSDVLSFLRDPPPELLLMSAEFASEDEAAAAEVELDFKVDVKVEKDPRTATARKQPVSPPTPSGGPQVPRNWHGNKRLKKEHIATFERVYRQSNRPSNTMIENLVNLTHVPRKKILQWFDDKRAQNQPKKLSFEDAPEN